MRHRWALILSLLSLIFSLAAASMGVASRSRQFTVEWMPSQTESHVLSSGPTGLAYVHLRAHGPGVLLADEAAVGKLHFRVSSDPSIHIPIADRAYPQRLGFAVGSETWNFADDRSPTDADTLTRTVVQAPHWSAVLLLALLPAGHVIAAAKRRRRAARGQCRACGYDLRATPDRCPECGVAS